MKPRKIAVVGNLAHVGYMLTDALRLAEVDADLYVTAKTDAMPPAQDPYLRYNLAPQSWIRIFATRPLVQAFFKGRRTFASYDLVIALTLSPIYVQFFGRPFAVVATGSDAREFAFGHGLQSYLLRRAYRRACQVYCTNVDLVAPLKKLGITALYLPLIVDIPDQIPDVERAGTLNIFWPTSWVRVKGIERFIAACGPLFKKGYAFDVTMVDHRASEDVPADQVALAQAFQKMYPDHVTFVPRMLRRDALMKAYLAADIVADEFMLGDMVLVNLEAMALARPSLHYFKESDAAFYDNDMPPILNASTAEEIAAVLERILTDPDMRKTLDTVGSEGRVWVQRHHSAQRVIAGLLASLERS